MRFLTVLIAVVVLLGCKKKEIPKPPERVQLVFPEKNSECTTGEDISVTTSQVEFRWQAANNTNMYELRVTDINTNTTQTINTASPSAKLPLLKGDQYSWMVTSKNSEVVQTVVSETWRFYNAGFETSYAPFPAEIVNPKMGANIFKDRNNEVELRWMGEDIDEDIKEYEIYLSTENPPENLVSTLDMNAVSEKVIVVANTIYFWRVLTKDNEGNSSDSGVFEFKVH